MENILLGLPFVFTKIISIYETIIVIYALLSWFPGAYNSYFGKLIAKVVAPFLNLIDRIVPPIMGMSFSPIIAILILEFLTRIIGSIF